MLVNAGMAHKHLEIKDHQAVFASAEKAGGAPDFARMLQTIAENNDKDSFIELFQHFAPRIKSFFIKGGADPGQADEWAQETMLTVWNKASSFDPAKAAASTWIFTIARNKRIDSLRRAASRPETQLPELLAIEDTAPRPGESLMQAEDNALVAAALEQLPGDQAQLIRKSFFEGKSHADIAKETGLPLGTVKSRIRLALERLRKNLNAGDVR